MKILIKSAKIVNAHSPYNGQVKDLLVEDGIIQKIEDQISESSVDQTIEQQDLHISIGWMDMMANFCDPGNEHKETLESGSKAARSGGFTAIALSPETAPAVDKKSQVEYIRARASMLPLDIYPLGGVTEKLKGEQLTELYDMHKSGAVGFCDGLKNIDNPGILTRALYYTQIFDAPVLAYSEDKDLAGTGMINEGLTSVKTGLKSRPALAEETIVDRNIRIAEYTKRPLHLIGISSGKSVELIRNAKSQGIQVSASVAINNLYYNEEALEQFDSNLKVIPVIRKKDDQSALIEGVKDGTIEGVFTNHQPQNIEEKACEFDHADYGAAGLESAFGSVHQVLNDIPSLVEAFTIFPRKLFKIDLPELAEGKEANLTLFVPSEEWEFEKSHVQSQAYNYSQLGKFLKGKVVGTLLNKDLHLN